MNAHNVDNYVDKSKKPSVFKGPQDITEETATKRHGLPEKSQRKQCTYFLTKLFYRITHTAHTLFYRIYKRKTKIDRMKTDEGDKKCLIRRPK